MRLRKLVTNRWVHVYPGLVYSGRRRGEQGYWNHYWCVGSQGRDMAAGEPPWEQNGLPTMVNIMQVVSAKSQSVRGTSHPPAFMGSCLLVTCGSFVYLVVDELRPCVLWPLMVLLVQS